MVILNPALIIADCTLPYKEHSKHTDNGESGIAGSMTLLSEVHITAKIFESFIITNLNVVYLYKQYHFNRKWFQTSIRLIQRAGKVNVEYKRDEQKPKCGVDCSRSRWGPGVNLGWGPGAANKVVINHKFFQKTKQEVSEVTPGAGVKAFKTRSGSEI